MAKYVVIEDFRSKEVTLETGDVVETNPSADIERHLNAGLLLFPMETASGEQARYRYLVQASHEHSKKSFGDLLGGMLSSDDGASGIGTLTGENLEARLNTVSASSGLVLAPGQVPFASKFDSWQPIEDIITSVTFPGVATVYIDDSQGTPTIPDGSVDFGHSAILFKGIRPGTLLNIARTFEYTGHLFFEDIDLKYQNDTVPMLSGVTSHVKHVTALRTSFESTNGQPIFFSDASGPQLVIDLRHQCYFIANEIIINSGANGVGPPSDIELVVGNDCVVEDDTLSCDSSNCQITPVIVGSGAQFSWLHSDYTATGANMLFRRVTLRARLPYRQYRAAFTSVGSPHMLYPYELALFNPSSGEAEFTLPPLDASKRLGMQVAVKHTVDANPTAVTVVPTAGDTGPSVSIANGGMVEFTHALDRWVADA